MNAKEKIKSWLKRNKLYILAFIAILGELVLLTNPNGRSAGISLLEAVGFMSLFAVGVLIVDYNHKNPHKISAFIKHRIPHILSLAASKTRQ